MTLIACGASSTPVVQTGPTSLADAAEQTYLYLLPLFALGGTRASYRNLFLHRPTLADASSRSVTTPNNDTLYSSAWLDLSGGPLMIHLPASGDRYFSLALMDFYSNNFAVRGTRHDGGEAKTLWLAGPDWRGEPPDGVELIRAPTPSVWALGRTYVRDETDIAAAFAVQLQLFVTSAPGTAAPADLLSDQMPVPDAQDWFNYFVYTQQLLAENPPPDADTAFLSDGGPAWLGIGKDNGFDPEDYDDEEKAAIATGAKAAYERAIDGIPGQQDGGWIGPQPHLGNFGTDYAYRASVAMSGLGALPNEEAMYFFGAGDTGDQHYDGSTHTYSLTFKASELPPADAFWSVTLYQIESNGQLFFYDHPDGRYAIKSGDDQLHYETDGSLVLYFGHALPAGAPEHNWLPAPAGAFALALRAYLPQPALLEQQYALPPVERISATTPPPS